MGTWTNIHGAVNCMLALWRARTTEFFGSIPLGDTVTRYPNGLGVLLLICKITDVLKVLQKN